MSTEKTKEKTSAINPEGSEKQGKQLRVLVVDDDADLAKLLVGFFQKANMKAEYATQGKAAIAQFKEFRPQLVLLDLLLPDIMGLDVLKRMKESTWAKGVTFLIMSGVMKDPQTVSKIKRDLGAADFIEKPFKVREMHNVILKHLGMEQLGDTDKKERKKEREARKTDDRAPVIPEPEVTIQGGELALTDLSRILCAFFTAQVTGVLKVSNGEMVKAVYFEEGKPIFAASKDPNDRFGEIAFRNGILTKKQIDEGLKKCPEHLRLGSTLVELGYLSSHTLYSLIQLQVREIIYSLFEWSKGRYAFIFEDLAGREMIKLQTPPADLVLKGIRRCYTPERLNKLLVSQKRVLAKSENPLFRYQSLHLGTEETHVLKLINGKRSIERLIKESNVDENQVLQLLYGLLAMKVVEDREKRHSQDEIEDD